MHKLITYCIQIEFLDIVKKLSKSKDNFYTRFLNILYLGTDS